MLNSQLRGRTCLPRPLLSAGAGLLCRRSHRLALPAGSRHRLHRLLLWAVLGLPHVEWLRDPDWAMTAVVLISVWRWFGFNLVILLAGLQGISESYYEAAEVDGASSRSSSATSRCPCCALRCSLLSSTPSSPRCRRSTRSTCSPAAARCSAPRPMVVYIYRQGFINFDMGLRQRRRLVLFGSDLRRDTGTAATPALSGGIRHGQRQ